MGTKLSKPDLFEALGYKPHAGQVLVHRSTATRRVLACGVRWGKSTCAVMETAAALLQPREECLGWTVAPTLDLARLVFERTATTLMRKFKHRVKLYSPRTQRLEVINFGGGRSVLEGKTADHATSLLGASLDFVIVDEAARMKEEIWTEHISQRLIDKRGWALFVSTPRGREWFSRLHRRGQKGRDPAFESWSSPSWTNPHIDRALIEEERGRLKKEVFDEQYGAVFAGDDFEPCDTCHGPSPTAPGIVVVTAENPLRRCPECGKAVDERGRSLVCRWGDNRPHLIELHLEGRPGGRPLPERGPGLHMPMWSTPAEAPPRLPESDLPMSAR